MGRNELEGILFLDLDYGITCQRERCGSHLYQLSRCQRYLFPSVSNFSTGTETGGMTGGR
jgi:hypothetical protein